MVLKTDAAGDVTEVTLPENPADPLMVKEVILGDTDAKEVPVTPPFKIKVLGVAPALVTVMVVKFAAVAPSANWFTNDVPEFAIVTANPVNSVFVSTKVTVCESPVNCKFNVPAPVA